MACVEAVATIGRSRTVSSPEERTCNLAAPTIYRKGPLYVLPNLLLYKVVGVGLGIARGAIEDFVALAKDKPLTF
jgi:hypothetical protein